MRKLLLYTFLLLLFSCETDSYEKGQGKYSLMRADFAELTVNSQQQGVGFVTDEGEQLALANPLTASWITRPDTTYRAIVYYNKVENGRAEIVSLGRMGVLSPVPHWRLKEMPQIRLA